MVAVRLRYLAHDLEVPMGQFVVGRSPDCQLSLDDPLVSRRHALLTVRSDEVFVEDLVSRNGVLVNDVRIEGRHKLSDGDKITIGGQTMSMIITRDTPARPGKHETLANAPPQRQDGLPTLVEHEEDQDDQTSIGLSPLLAHDRPPDRRVHALSLIGGVANKALAMGRADEAERLLTRPLTELRSKVESNQEANPEAIDLAATFAARLAAATGRGSWIDYIFSLYGSLGRLLPAPLIDELYRIVRKVKGIDLVRLGDYTASLRARAHELGPTDRFLQQRIEGLERLIALK